MTSQDVTRSVSTFPRTSAGKRRRAQRALRQLPALPRELSISQRILTHTVAGPDSAVFSARLCNAIMGVAYMLAGTVGALTILLGAGDPATLALEWSVAGASFVLGYLIARWGHHLPLGIGRGPLVLVLGSVLVSLSVAYAGSAGATVDTALLYFLPALGAGIFFPMSRALPVLVFIEVCSILAFARAGVPESNVVILQVMLFGTACAAAWLARVAAAGERDALTGLANRRKFDRRLEELLVWAKRPGRPLSVVVLDLDEFKAVNDIHGHDEGDRLLVAVSRLWQERLSSGQLLCRQGGDEFALILPGYSLIDARALADELRDAASSEIGCSLGVAQLEEHDNRSMLLKRADVDLYRSKDYAGRERRRTLPTPAPARPVTLSTTSTESVA